jgi:hypothetical protein
MPNVYREARVWNGTEWESISVAYPDLSQYARTANTNTFTATNTFNAPIIRPSQVPYAMEIGTVNLTTSGTGDQLIIGTKNFDAGRFNLTPIVISTVMYPNTGVNGFVTIKATSSTSFTYEVDMNVPVLSSNAGTGFPLKISYFAYQLTA